MYIDPGNTFGDSTRLLVGLALNGLLVMVDQILLVDVYTGIDSVNHGLIVEFEVCLCCPCVFDSLEFIARLSSPFGSDHQIVEWLKVGISATKNEGVISGIDGRGD